MSHLKQCIPLFTNLGYFISAYVNDDIDKIGNKIDILVNVYDSETTGIILEPKYDILINPIPKILYHASPFEFKSKILKNGFIPKAGNKRSAHLDRIYLTDSLERAMIFGNELKTKDFTGKNNKKFCVYEIDGTGIKNLYSDINWRSAGFYTDQNISPEFIKLIFEK